MKLEYIRFIFENCERIVIDGKYIGDFVVEDIKRYVRRVASNSIADTEIANIFAIEIHKDANVEECPLWAASKEHYKRPIFERFTEYNDITHIEFKLVDEYVAGGQPHLEKEYSYSIHWNSDGCYEFENKFQTSYISKQGHLYVVIAENKTIDDFFDVEEIDDEDCMNFKFEMYDIGIANNREVITNEMIDEIYDNIMGDN